MPPPPPPPIIDPSRRTRRRARTGPTSSPSGKRCGWRDPCFGGGFLSFPPPPLHYQNPLAIPFRPGFSPLRRPHRPHYHRGLALPRKSQARTGEDPFGGGGGGEGCQPSTRSLLLPPSPFPQFPSDSAFPPSPPHIAVVPFPKPQVRTDPWPPAMTDWRLTGEWLTTDSMPSRFGQGRTRGRRPT